MRRGTELPARLMVRAASLLVPRAERDEWMAEWNAEVHHLCRELRSGDGDSPQCGPLEFSLGAFRDAFWICWDRVRSDMLPVLQSGSAARCGLLLASIAMTALIACFSLPGARHALLAFPGGRSGSLVMISGSGYASAQSPSIRIGDYREWTTNTAALFTQIAFYRPTTKGVHVAHHAAARLTMAQASDNLLQLVGAPLAVIARRPARRGEPRLILSHAAWHRVYHGDRGVIGRTADIDGQPVVIEAIIADDQWRLPGKFDALLLEDERTLDALPARAPGFVVARIRDSAFPAPRGGWRVMTETRNGVTRRFDCISVAHLPGQPFSVFLFALLMASLALPATTALPLGDYPLRRGRLPATVNARRWIFLAIKFAMVLVIVDLCSTDLAYGLWTRDPITSLYIQLATAFPALLFGFRWMLVDQRRRCPECLRLLSNPARVGQASCNFLSWSGTELFCVRGHGLLHIPELPTSWFSTQRWLCLDSSWRCLFPETRSPSPRWV